MRWPGTSPGPRRPTAPSRFETSRIPRRPGSAHSEPGPARVATTPLRRRSRCLTDIVRGVPLQVAHFLEDQGAGLGPKAIDLHDRDRLGIANDGAERRGHVDVADDRCRDQAEDQEEQELRAHREFHEGRRDVGRDERRRKNATVGDQEERKAGKLQKSKRIGLPSCFPQFLIVRFGLISFRGCRDIRGS